MPSSMALPRRSVTNGLCYPWVNLEALRLEPGDLIRVVEAYSAGELKGPDGRPVGGSLPAAVGLHPWLLNPELATPEWRAKYRPIHRELTPDVEAVKAKGIEVTPVSGTLSWEVHLYPDTAGTSEPRPIAPTEHTSYNTPFQIGGQGPVPVGKSVVRSNACVLLPPHRPRVFGKDVDRRIEALAGEGLGARSIHRLLTAEGIKISLSSVSKRLQQIRRGGER